MSTSIASKAVGPASGQSYYVSSVGGELAPRFEMPTETGGALRVIGVPVFRSGKFRDMWGDETVWESIHIDQMVANYGLLSGSKIFADVPVRDGHPGFLYSGGSQGSGRTVGYVTSLYSEVRTAPHDGNEYTYLLADCEILDVPSQDAIFSGLWRSLSSEIGTYETNAGTQFWPVFMGVAYVDIPAVEGLKGFSKNVEGEGKVYIMDDFTENEETAPAPEAPATDETPETPAAGDGPPLGDEATEAPGGGEAVEVPEPIDSAPDAAAGGSGQSFAIGGRKVYDFAEVQRTICMYENQISELAEFRRGVLKKDREDFVKHLSNSGKILASQIDDTTAFASGLTEDQYAKWKKLFSGSAPVAALGKYDDDHGGDTFEPGVIDETARRIDTLRGVIQQHTRAGMSRSDIEATSSFKKLKALDPEFKL